MPVERYSLRTQPQAAQVARPGPSALTQIGQAAPGIIEPILRDFDRRNASLEQAALNTARRRLIEEGDKLEKGLQTTDAAGEARGAAGDGYVPDVQTSREKLKDQIWSGVPKSVRESARAQAAWDDIWTDDSIQATRRATAWQDGQQQAYTKQAITETMDGIAAQVEAEPYSAQAALKDWQGDIPRYAGILAPAQLAELKSAGEREIFLAQIRGLSKAGKFEAAQEVVTAVAAQLGVDNREQARRAIDQDEAKAQAEVANLMSTGILDGKAGRAEIDAAFAEHKIDAGQKASLIRAHMAMVDRAEAEIARQQAAQKAAATAWRSNNKEAIDLAILKGEAGEADVDIALAAGLIDNGQAATLIRSAREGKNKRDLAAMVAGKIDAGEPLDPYDPDIKKGIDEIWRTAGGSSLFMQQAELPGPDGKIQGTVNRGTQEVLAAAHDVGVIPPDAASTLQGFAANGTDEQRQVAYDTIARLAQTNPAALSAAFPDGSDRAQNDAISWKRKVDAGMAPVDALRAVERENAAVADPVLKERSRLAKKASAEFTPDMIRQGLKQGGVPFLGDAPDFAPGAGEAAVAMFRETYEANFLRSGDDALARIQASASLRKVLGTTSVGSRTTMAYPPEALYPPALEERQPGWLGLNLTGAVQDLVDHGLIGEADERVRPEDLRLISDGITASNVREGQPPTYVIQWKGETLDQRFQFDPEDAWSTAVFDAQHSENETLRKGEIARAFVQGGWMQEGDNTSFAILNDRAGKSAEALDAAYTFTQPRTNVRARTTTAADLIGTIGTINKKYDGKRALIEQAREIGKFTRDRQ